MTVIKPREMNMNDFQCKSDFVLEVEEYLREKKKMEEKAKNNKIKENDVKESNFQKDIESLNAKLELNKVLLGKTEEEEVRITVNLKKLNVFNNEEEVTEKKEEEKKDEAEAKEVTDA